MNTSGHAIVNLLLLGRGKGPELAAPITLGAILPDVPSFVFYGYQKIVLGTPERIIWSEAYFAPGWRAVFDVFHSLPLLAIGMLLAHRASAGKRFALFSSMGLHSVCDLLLHHDDAHRHFFPFFDWRFESPVSYWDLRHYGGWVASIEAMTVLFGSIWLMTRYRSLKARLALALVVVTYGVNIGYALLMWAS